MAERQLPLPLAVVARIGVPTKEARVRRQTYPDDPSDRPKTVHPRELLAVGPASRVVPDRHLVDPIAEPEHPRRDVGFDFESIPVQVETAPEVGPQRLVAALEI